MKKVDFECCNILYYIESDVQKEHKCCKCNAKFKKNKEGEWKIKK